MFLFINFFFFFNSSKGATRLMDIAIIFYVHFVFFGAAEPVYCLLVSKKEIFALL